MKKKLLIICGEEGVGKSTLTRTIVSDLTNGVAFDAENILQVNPFEYGDAFQELAIDTTSRLVNSYFDHGYEQVVAASFVNEYEWLVKFQKKLSHECEISVLILTADKEERDQRRNSRDKRQTQEEKDYIDENFSITTSLKDHAKSGAYKYHEMDTTGMSIEKTLRTIRSTISLFV